MAERTQRPADRNGGDERDLPLGADAAAQNYDFHRNASFPELSDSIPPPCKKLKTKVAFRAALGYNNEHMAKQRGGKLFGFSPSYSNYIHHRRGGDRNGDTV
jgi:hypothetical protein